jgi:uncharacterized 2Fe-2S/4Fe-4S cluster protein (DUF4445 family)
MISDNDKKHLTQDEIDQNVRLGCQHTISFDSRVVLLSQVSEIRILTESDPYIREMTVDEDLSDHVGVALDIGTTTIVAYLMDLATGQQLALASALNPQISYGEDIVTRLVAAAESDTNQRSLQHLVAECIENLVTDLVNETEIAFESCKRFSVVGNTVMHHFLLNLNTSTLNDAPYTPTLTEAQSVNTKQLGFKDFHVDVYIAPLIAGFVGSDVTAFILSQNLHETNEIVLGIDIGTNGEIVLSNKGELFACSTAAGSAFEGATISQGMRGQTGAIEHLIIPDTSGKPEISVIGQTAPRGICGSGIVDVVSELRRMNLLTPEGTMVETGRIVRDPQLGLGYVIIEKDEYSVQDRIIFTQKDVRQVQSAKAAIFAGTKILSSTAGIDVGSVDRILLAGAFGNYIKPRSALNIGLIPDIPLERVVQVGNTAGQGAKMMLLSKKVRKQAEEIVQDVTHVKLAGNSDFKEEFIVGTLFPHSA